MIPITSSCKLGKVFLDICGAFSRNRGRYRYRFIVIMMDYFSRYIKLYPITRATTKTILKIILQSCIPSIGKSRCIVTDHGTQFRGKRWKNELLDISVKTYKTSVYQPSINPTERVLREVARILRTYSHDSQRNWSQYVNTAEDFNNFSYHHYLEETPYIIMLGRPPPREISDLVNFPSDALKPFEISRIYNHIQEKNKRQRRKYEKIEYRTIRCNEGDKVLIKSRELLSAIEGITKKLLLLYTGPYVITKDNKNNTYEIIHPSPKKIKGVYNQASLKLYHESYKAKNDPIYCYIIKRINGKVNITRNKVR